MRAFAAAFMAAFLLAAPALAQNNFTAPGNQTVAGAVQMCLNANNQAIPCSTPPQGTLGAGYPAGATPITGNATGTTAAVVGTLAAAAGKYTYICGFNVATAGGTAASSPITVAGLLGSSQVYQTAVNTTNGQVLVTQNFFPCIPSSAVNTAITVTTTAAVGATAVDVNSWGYQE